MAIRPLCPGAETWAVTRHRSLSTKLRVLSWLLPPLLLMAAWAAGARATLAEFATIYMVLALLLAGLLRSRSA